MLPISIGIIFGFLIVKSGYMVDPFSVSGASYRNGIWFVNKIFAMISSDFERTFIPENVL